MSGLTELFVDRYSTVLTCEEDDACTLISSEQSLVFSTELGTDGLPGKVGPSPYEEWLSQGYDGSYLDFLASLKDGGEAWFDTLERAISDDPDNRLKLGTDNKLHVHDDLSPDPLVYYILAKD